jgi:hypothetical protein
MVAKPLLQEQLVTKSYGTKQTPKPETVNPATVAPNQLSQGSIFLLPRKTWVSRNTFHLE